MILAPLRFQVMILSVHLALSVHLVGETLIQT